MVSDTMHASEVALLRRAYTRIERELQRRKQLRATAVPLLIIANDAEIAEIRRRFPEILIEPAHEDV